MSAPSSLSPSPVVSLGDHSYKHLFEDDFSVNKFVLKTKATSAAKGIINYKGTYDCEKDSVGQEVKIQFPWRKYLLLKLKKFPQVLRLARSQTNKSQTPY
jgi:hypothetical protein